MYFRMDQKIHDATRRGDVKSLREILAADPAFPLADFKFTCFLRTPLHEAAIRGYVEFASVILGKDPEFAMKLDSQGCTPLHLASTGYNVKMVSVLIDANPDACLVQDIDGRTPLHLAAMRDEVRFVDLLIQSRPDAIHQRLFNTHETILHLCVKHNKLRAMKKLVKYLVDNRVDLSNNPNVISVNSVDHEGNTILHLAAQSKQMEILKYLIKSDDIGVDVNIQNNDEVKALHMLHRYEMDSLGISCYDYHNNYEVPQQSRSNEWVKERLNTLMIVATLIAAICFQAVVNPPGGVFQDDSKIDSITDPVRFVYYLRKVINEPSMYLGFQSLHTNSDIILSSLQKNTTRRNFTAENEIIHSRASFVWSLYLAATLNDSYTSPVSPYMTHNLGAGIVLEDNWWMNVTSKYKKSLGGRSGFSPYLIRYAGTAIMAYASPQIFKAYIFLNSLSLLGCIVTILVVASDVIRQRPPGSRASLVGFLEVLLGTAVACLILSYGLVCKTTRPRYTRRLGLYGITEIEPYYGTVRQLSYTAAVVGCLTFGVFLCRRIFAGLQESALFGRRSYKLFSYISNPGAHKFTWYRFIAKMALFFLALIALAFITISL